MLKNKIIILIFAVFVLFSCAVPVTELRISKTHFSMITGREERLTVIAVPLDAANREVTWSSSDTSVAVVSQDGVVTSVSAGNAVITARSKNNITAQCNVRVFNPFTRIDQIRAYLNSSDTQGLSADNPYYLPVALEDGLGNMTDPKSGWQQLLGVCNKFVELDLSACSMTGNIFNPVFNLTTGKRRIVSLVLPDAAIIIPDGDIFDHSTVFRHFDNLKSVSAKRLIRIGNYAFMNRRELIDIDFPSVTSIGEWAFLNCKGLEKISFPNAVTIGNNVKFKNDYYNSGDYYYSFEYYYDDAFFFYEDDSIEIRREGLGVFRGCDNLFSVEFPKAVHIGISAFRGCKNLKEANFPSAVTIGENAFSECITLSRADFPNVVNVEDRAFINCRRLEELYFPLAEYLGAVAFSRCRNIKEINFPNVKNIGQSSFFGCENLVDVRIPLLLEAGELAFSFCTNLQEVSFPFLLTIGKSSFSSAKSLADINLPMLETIGSSAFYKCESLVSVSFPAAESMGLEAFWGCTSLVSISAPNLKTIGERAFSGCISLEQMDFPQADTIGIEAFSGCTGIKDINFPNVKRVSREAFLSCINLVSVYLPSAEFIGNGNFRGCTSLATVNLPAVNLIESRAFENTGTHDFTLILGETAPSLGTKLFGDEIKRTIHVFVPNGANLMRYFPFTGEVYTISGAQTSPVFSNGIRGGGWRSDSRGTVTILNVSNINRNITVIISWLQESQ